MNDNQEDPLRQVRKKKVVVGRRQSSRRIKQNVDSFFKKAHQQVDQNGEYITIQDLYF